MAEFVQSKMTVIQPDGTIFGSPESLEKYWDEYCNVPKDDCCCIKEPFLMFPKGTNDFEICEWFNKMYPDGLLVLMKKRMTKKYGEEYVHAWNIFEKQLNTVNVAHLICTPPDLARTREYQAKRRGYRMSIQPVDDPVELMYPAETLEKWWVELGDIPVDDDGIIQESFLWWPKGTDREDIWHWFDEKYPGGVVKLMGLEEENNE